jgi:hypothetical protein
VWGYEKLISVIQCNPRNSVLGKQEQIYDSGREGCWELRRGRNGLRKQWSCKGLWESASYSRKMGFLGRRAICLGTRET